ncbi:MAG: PQQ-binding-like beta-propeller repeat protein, partial [Chthoniobacteraceae bacterium]
PKNLTPAQLFQLAERPVLNMTLVGTNKEVGERGMPVFTDSIMFRSEFRDPAGVEVERGVTRVAVPKYDVLRAYKLGEASWKVNVMPRRKTGDMQRELVFPIAWELAVPQLTVKLLAGDRLYLAGADKIVAVAVPKAGEKPRVVWEEKVEGFPVGVIAANDHLIVTTDEGRLYCFGAAGSAVPKFIADEKPAAWEHHAEWREQVAKLKGGLTPGGCGLVLGWNSGELAKELASQTDLHVIVAEPDAAIAAKARVELQNAGTWAKRLHIISGTSDSLKLPPYFAEIVLSESTKTLDSGAREWTRMAIDALRPFTGVAALPLRPKLVEQAQAQAEKLGGYEFSTDRHLTAIRRIAAPKGADNWTHEAANAGNTFASTDTLAVPPFGLLWYSGTIDREFSPAFEFHHDRNPYPTIANGRMFMLAASVIYGVDVYTGRSLWKTAVPESAKAGRRTSEHRTFSRPTDQNLIATADRVYVFRESDAQMFDSATGKQLGVIGVPPALRGKKADTPWDEVRIEGDTMFVTIGTELVAMDRRSGEVRWHRTGAQEHAAFGMSDDRLFVVDYTSARAQKPDKAGAFETRITVLNAKDGEAYWNAPLRAPGRPDQSDQSAGKPKWSGIFQDNPLKPTLHYSAKHQVVLAVVDRHQFYAFDAQSGSPLWQYDSRSSLTDLVLFEPPTVT